MSLTLYKSKHKTISERRLDQSFFRKHIFLQQRLCSKLGSNPSHITVILITHYMDEAAHAGRVVVLDDGRIRFDGTPSEVFSHEEELRETGLDVPYPTALVHRLRKAGMSLEGDCLTPEQCAELIANELKK